MGLGGSNMGGSAPSHRPEPLQRRHRPSIRRSISSFLLCGTSSSSSRVMEDCPAELLVTSAEIGDGESLEDRRKRSNLSTPNFRGNAIDSAAEVANFDAGKGINSITSRYSSRISEAPRNYGSRESSPDEVSAGNNNIAESIDWGDAFNCRILVPEREQNRQEGSLLQGDLTGAYSNIFLSNSVEINGHDIRNYRRSFSVSRNSFLSTDESDYSRSPDSWHHDFSGDFFGDSLQGSFGSRGSGTHGSNELGWNSRSEFWERLRGSHDSTDTPTDVCPRRIHADSSCLCRSGLSAEESGSRAVSRIVLLAQTLFEVLDQIHQQPMSLSLSTVSLPAPESHVDSLPVKIHRKEMILGCAEDVSQCHICLASYEEGDEIRVLPCQHEYRMSCVDKWLKEIHGVCPLCRGDICKSGTEASCPKLEILPH